MGVLPRRVAAVLSVLIVVAGCGSSGTPRPTSGPSDSPVVESPEPTAAPSTPTSETLIAEALARGSITEEQSLLYRALALFDSPGLPTEYKSPIRNMEAAGELLRDVTANESKLSADTLAKLAPYRVRPNDPISIFNNPPVRAQVDVLAAAAIGPGIHVDAPPAAPTPVWEKATAAGGKARVWSTASADLATYAGLVSEVWAAYPGIFTYPRPDQPNLPSAAVNPDSAIDFYFVDTRAIDPRDADCAANPSGSSCSLGSGISGFAPRAEAYVDNKSSGYVVLEAGAGRDKTIDTIAHELAHTAQFAYDHSESSWLMESTATWVAYKVVQKLKIDPAYQHAWLPQLFATLDKTLTRESDDNAYASWLYFQYASMEKGDGVVTDIWKAAAADGEQGYKAADQVFPFKDHFDGYALRDWNQEPVKPMYKSVDSTFPDREPKLRNRVKTLVGGKEDVLNANLSPLSAAYYEYDFPAAVRSVTFDNYLDGYTNARVWAIPKIGGEWKAPEDWSGLAKKKYCRDVAGQEVQTVILVVSNVGTTDPLDVPDGPKMKADLTGCAGWQGTMTGSAGWTNEGHTGTSQATFSGIWLLDENGDAECNEYSEDHCVLYRPAGTIAWTYQDDYPAKNFPCHYQTSGSKAAGQESHDDQQNFFLVPKDDEHLQFWGRGYFQWPDVTCMPPDPTTSTPVFFDIYRNYSSSLPPADGGTCMSTDWVIPANATTIEGSCYHYNTRFGWEKFEWHLTRVGPAPGK